MKRIKSYNYQSKSKCLRFYNVIFPVTASVVQMSEFLATDPEVRVHSRRYQIFWEVVGLQRGPLSLVSTIEDLLGRKSSGSGLEIREYGCRDPSRWPRGTHYS
jgi:hypothetical protein